MIKFYPCVFNGTLRAPASAAFAHRALFAAALAHTPTLVKNVPKSKDIDVTLDCLRTLGCRLSITDGDRMDVMVEPFQKTTPLPTADFNFYDSASTSRFALTVCGALGIRAACRASGTLPRRPLVDFTSRLSLRGMTFSNFSFPLKMQGRLEGGEYVCKGEINPEYICALLIGLPLLREDSFVKVEGEIRDRASVDMTLKILDAFGIIINEEADGFDIPGQQYFESPGEITVENDWCLSTLWTLAGSASAAKGGRVVVTDLQPESKQGYRNTLDYFSLISQDFDYVEVFAQDFPNHFPYFASIVAGKGATATIYGVEQLKYEESDRMKLISECIENFGADCLLDESTNILTINRRSGFEMADNLVIDSKGDPMIFIALALTSCVIKKPFSIEDEEGYAKCYANFLRDFQVLGGRFEII